MKGKAMKLPISLADQCAFARAVGYDGLEIAPFTLGEDPTRMSASKVADARRIVENHGLFVSSLHWLTMAPEGLDLEGPGLGTELQSAFFERADLMSRASAP